LSRACAFAQPALAPISAEIANACCSIGYF
jgi:hypothetical protein